MKKTYKKKEEKLTSEGSELRQPVAELEAPATERKQTEEALRESEETKSAILNATPDFIAVVDKEGIVSDINKAMAEKFGKQPKEIIGSNSWYLIPPELAKSRKRYIDEVFQTGKPCRFEDENGGIYFDNIVYPIVEDQGKVTRVALQARDITERKQAEEKLQTILKTALDGFTIDNLEGKILEANDSYCKMVGYTRDELLKMSVADVEVIESPEETTQRIKIIKEQGFDRFETRHKRKDGKIIDVEVSVNHLDVGEGQLFIFARDITDRKRAEEALKESEQKYRTIFENVSEVIIRLDRYGKIVDINGRSEECFGYKPEEVIGKNFARIGVLSLKDLPKMVKLFGEIIRGKRAPFILELEAKRKDGSPVLIEVNSKLVEKDGKKEGFVTIVRDITERKRAEEKLETILKTALDGFWLTNLEGKILEVNDSYCKMVGYSREELLKMSIADLEAIESPQEVAQHIKGIIEQGYGRFESRHKHKDGKIIDVEISVNYLDVGEGQFFVFARDITERKRVEKALKAEKNKLQSLIDTMEDGLNIRDKDFNIIYQNEPVRRLYGDRIGEKCYRVYEGRDRVCDGCPVKKAFKDGKSHTSERRSVTPSGEVLFWENTANPIRDAGGEIISCLEITRNITERKQAEKALRDSEEKTRKMFESVSDGISVVDLNGVITEVNQRTVEMHSLSSKDELVGKSAFDIVAPRDREKIAKNMRQALKRGTIRDQEYTLLKADGSEFPAELSTSVLKDASGKAIGHITISRDITERKQAEEALKLRAQILDGATDIIQVHDASDNFVYVNEAACIAHGYSREELLKMKLTQIVAPERLRPLASDRQELLETGHIIVESAHMRKDGSVFPVEVHARTIESGGGKLFLTVAHDITERKQSEEREKELQKELLLSSRLAAIGELAAGVAHQINNPLTGVLGFSQRLLRKSTDQETNQDLKRIYTEAERAAKVVQNLLTFARRRQTQKQYSDINDILESALELRAYELKTSNIEVVTDLTPGLPEIMLDFHQIQEVFLNIILNAEQAITEANGGGKLTIKTEERKGDIRTTFTDNGPGIPAENLEKIFDPFFSTKGEKGGTGLGLSVCHGIISEHGGRIYAKSKPGKGAIFFVELPLPGH